MMIAGFILEEQVRCYDYRFFSFLHSALLCLVSPFSSKFFLCSIFLFSAFLLFAPPLLFSYSLSLYLSHFLLFSTALFSFVLSSVSSHFSSPRKRVRECERTDGLIAMQAGFLIADKLTATLQTTAAIIRTQTTP